MPSPTTDAPAAAARVAGPSATAAPVPPAPRRRSRARSKGLAAVAALTLAAVACSSTTTTTSTPGTDAGSTPGGTGATPANGSYTGSPATTDIQLAYNADMQVPDPDIFYEIEGNSLVTSVYEGLVRYQPNSTKIEGALAQTWDVSADGMTYTFHLRPNVKFHDGTVLDSAAAKASFERRTNVNSAPAYMLADVDHYETPDPSTFVVKLKNPVSPFLDYLAAPYGPKMVSPALLTAHAGSDFAQSWLKDHDAGTGPFTITDFELGTKYVVTAFPDYWGGKPKVTSITMNILPDISTQQLKLQSGDLSMIIHGLTADDISSLQQKGFQIQRFPALFKTLVMMNPNKEFLKDKATRQAVAAALDKDTIEKTVYGDNASTSTQIYPAGELPEGTAKDPNLNDPSKLQAIAGNFTGKTLDIGYSSDDPRNGRVADLIQTELQAAGITATTRAIPIAQVFNLPQAKDQAPDLLVSTVNPDAAHPDTWARIFMSTAGSLNWLQCSVPDADKLLDAGLRETDQAKMQDDYAKAGDLFVDSGCFASIADVREVIVAKPGYGNFVHQLPTVFSIRFGDLTVG
jgi:peptide/nickel transport system substrate-binding protein